MRNNCTELLQTWLHRHFITYMCAHLLDDTHSITSGFLHEGGIMLHVGRSGRLVEVEV